jgi:hypothetical protein
MYKLAHGGINISEINYHNCETPEERIALLKQLTTNKNVVFSLSIRYNETYADILVFQHFNKLIIDAIKQQHDAEMFLFEHINWADAYEQSLSERESTPLF